MNMKPHNFEPIFRIPLVIGACFALQATSASANDRGKANREKLRTIILPTLHFTEVPLSEAIAFLELATKQHDPKKKGVPFKMLEDPPSHPINLRLSNVPVADALRFTAELSGVDYLVKSTGIEVGEGVAKGLESRNFRVPQKLAAKIAAAGGAEKYWLNLGARLPDGSSIAEPRKKGGNMTAAQNPVANLKLIEKHIAQALEAGDTPTMTATEEKLESITLPALRLDRVTLEEAVDLLHRRSRELDPAKNPQQRGVNLIIKGHGFDLPQGEENLIKLQLMKVSLKAAVEAVAEKAGVTIDYSHPWAVVFVKKKAAD